MCRDNTFCTYKSKQIKLFVEIFKVEISQEREASASAFDCHTPPPLRVGRPLPPSPTHLADRSSAHGLLPRIRPHHARPRSPQSGNGAQLAAHYGPLSLAALGLCARLSAAVSQDGPAISGLRSLPGQSSFFRQPSTGPTHNVHL